MPQYLLLLYDNPSAFADVSPEQMQKIIQRYMAWGTKLHQAGVMRGRNKLTDEPGKVMRRKDNQVRVTDGPYSEAKELLAGYYLIETDSYEKAAEHASDCPHLDFGGTIEIRQVDQV